MKYLILYLIVINMIALIVTVYDKRAAEKHKWRVKERTLMIISALGGAPLMYLTMLTIGHKIRKPLFMAGIPIIFIIECIIGFLVLHYGFRII